MLCEYRTFFAEYFILFNWEMWQNLHASYTVRPAHNKNI